MSFALSYITTEQPQTHSSNSQQQYNHISTTQSAWLVALVVKNLPANEGDIRDVDSISGLGRSPGGGHGNPLQYSAWRIPMDRGA